MLPHDESPSIAEVNVHPKPAPRRRLTCGIDEVGRGPLAGPVTAAALLLPWGADASLLDDSKRLSPRRRIAALESLVEYGAIWATGWAWPREIDALNIHHATMLAMRRAWDALPAWAKEATGTIVIDGAHVPPGMPAGARAVPRGDASELPVMGASIVAKVARDTWMEAAASRFPPYRFERHKGYPTREHTDAINRFGPTLLHRRSFHVPRY